RRGQPRAVRRRLDDQDPGARRRHRRAPRRRGIRRTDRSGFVNYFSHNPADEAAMLADIGLPSMQALIDRAIPPSVQLKRPLDLKPGPRELELRREMGVLDRPNANPATHASILGAGNEHRYIPAAPRP